jgi:cytoskeletal protein CcmA (bactofilin family)
MFKKLFKNNTKKLDQLPINTIIADEVSIIGNIKGKNTIRIDGNVEGNIEMAKGIILGAKSFVKGSLNSDSIIVYGKLNGDLICKELHIKNTGIIDGNIVVDILKVDMGGRYSGSLRMDMKDGNNTPEDITTETPYKKSGNENKGVALFLAKIRKR